MDDRDPGFLGTGWAFPPGFDAASGRVRTVSGERDVRESLLILLSTQPGERVMQPEYGCGLRRMLFETMDHGLLTEIRDLIEQAIARWEPRVVLHRVDLDTDDWLEGVLRIGLDYTLRRTHTRHNLVFPFYLDAGAAAAGADELP